MTNFPTKQHWFDHVWPETNPYGGKVMVPVQRHTNLEDIDKEAMQHPDTTFMLIVEDFDFFCDNMPIVWRRINAMGVGGIPPNVWIGASINNQKEADTRMRRLVKIRARVLFLFLKAGHPQTLDLKAGLIAWRCANCGRKDGYNRMKRPEACPSGMICDGARINPQIHWVVSMDAYESEARATRCARLGIAFWDGETIEVPEEPE
jgi:hypothetical protein